MANMAVYSDSTKALITADATYAFPLVPIGELLVVRARAYNQSNTRTLKMLVELIKENFQMSPGQ